MKKTLKFFKDLFLKIKDYFKTTFNLKHFIVVISTLVLAIIFIVLCSFKYSVYDFWFESPPGPIQLVRVVDIVGETVEDQSYENTQTINGETLTIEVESFKVFVVFDCRVLKGDNKGEIIRCYQELTLSNNNYSQDKIKVGKKLRVYKDPTAILWKTEAEVNQPIASEGYVTVSYVIDNDITHEELLKGSILTKPVEDPIKEGFHFFGWFYEGSEFLFNEEINSNIVLRAVFVEDVTWNFYAYDRINALIILAIVFLLFLIIYGKYKGLMSAFAVALTFIGVFVVYIPAIISGRNIYLWTIIICIYTILVTTLLIVGVNKKGLASIISCFVGVLLGAILTIILRSILSLSGNTTVEEYRIFSRGIILDTPIDMRALLFGAITIGTLGAVMDMGISMCSALKEISDESMHPSFKQTIKSGGVVGRDMIGTMSSTLILAYAGSSLAFIVFMMSFVDTEILLLREEIVIEIVQALIGCLVLISIVPIATFVCAFLYNKKKKSKIKLMETEDV
ncbi:MAG: YibE/F family protein [Bacilli bacterium]|jgi:uncharacterized membrane protein